MANEGAVTVAPVVNGKPGDIAGFTRVGQGTTKNVKMPLQVQLTSRTYQLSLYSGNKTPADTQQPLAATDVTVSVSRRMVSRRRGGVPA